MRFPISDQKQPWSYLLSFSHNSANRLSRSSKIDNLYVIRKDVCHFLLVINSNLGPISHCFRDMASFPLKIISVIH